MLSIPLARLPELLAAMAAEHALYVPLEQNGQVNFARWEKNTESCLNAPKTVGSVKDLFFPPSEALAAFQTRGGNIDMIETSAPAEPFAVFGVRGCDARGLGILDMVFLTDPADSLYQARRENATVITLACKEPEESCFCSVFGIDPAEPGGDITAWIAGETLYWRVCTEKGTALTRSLGALLAEAEGSAVTQQQAAIREVVRRLPLRDLALDRFCGENTLELFNSPLWNALSESCLGCGACTFLCPTCQCYDIRDFDTGSGVQRLRCWDSCMYSDFTLMSHGNPRATQVERFRQRFMHKLVYFPQNNGGVYACVGCGRCVQKCPVSMHMGKVAKAWGVSEHA